MTTLYGIKNCDTVKKARKWLEENNIATQFHDFRVDGLNRQQVQAWADQAGWETLLNKRSTTWKQLDAGLRDTIDANSAIDAMVEHPALIKRPILERAGTIQVGFKAEQYSAIFD